MKYAGIIFDLDGTLMDTARDLSDSVNHVLEERGFPTQSLEETIQKIGNGMFKLIQRSIPQEYREETELINQMRDDMIRYYKKKISGSSCSTVAYPHLSQTLRWLNENNVKLAVASNKSDDETKILINRVFPEVTFEKALGHYEGLPHKPDPKIIDEILKALDLKAEEVLYIGDSYTDYLTAVNSDLDYILVNYGYESREKLKSIPDARLIKSSTELCEMLERLFSKNGT